MVRPPGMTGKAVLASRLSPAPEYTTLTPLAAIVAYIDRHKRAL
jgi:hypothetical protein